MGGTDAMLLMDTCGERASVALVSGGALVSEVVLPEKTASTALLGVVREVLNAGKVQLAELAGLGIVSGPGSFTGVRIGLAVAKGMAESASLRIAAVSRLAVLADAGKLRAGVAVLRAGRDEVYVREQAGDAAPVERLMTMPALLEVARERELVYAEEALAPQLVPLQAARRLEITARHAWPLVQERLREGGDDLATLDANYVRDEQAIYTRQKVSA